MSFATINKLWAGLSRVTCPPSSATLLLSLLAGVVSTTPVVVSTWPTLLTTPLSEEGDFVVQRVDAVPAATQRLSPAERVDHALGGPDTPSRNMSVVVL